MSVRRSPPGAPAALGRATPPGKVASSRRLDAVLRAGTVVGTPVDASESGLTRALKKTSLVPTGACVARTFDPDYCAYDRYYAVGVALVSATLGVLTETGAIQATVNTTINALREALGRQCHVPEAEWWTAPNPQAKRFDQMDKSEKMDARTKFSFLCTSLDQGLMHSELYDGHIVHSAMGLPDIGPLGHLAMKLIEMIVLPAAGVSIVAYDFLTGGKGETIFARDVGDRVALGAWFASAAWILKYVSRYLNEHALMVASFFRVNAKRLKNGEPALLDIQDFVRRCKEDIANGPNPPPEPPAPEPPAEMEPAYDGEPYSPFSPGKMERQQREAKERRRLAELRARREARDPLMEGLDYPETYASASDAY